MGSRFSEIVRAGLAVAGRDGLSAVSMRAVAAEVGFTTMALYRHLPSKEALLDGMVGALLGELDLPDPADPWPARLRHVALELLALGRRYPTVMPLLLTRPYVAPEAVRVVRVMYGILDDAGVSTAELYRVERLISTHLLGYCVSVANKAFWVTEPDTLEVDTVPVAPPDAAVAGDRWRAELERNLGSLGRLIMAERAT
ncbi:TetR/AcrR family transcriptional regulator [Microlunatus parietis]|uniref:AcrR family transcriptional regulator n=1 Tax=Microlunatus parietis TaxID=682979 RepID=A0A7Y9IB36_9ACTN|nr:TetR family transcriptional regulator [Microlunatus parietis]NYE73420.1 AcrR family transcriptional regulator [Microlunatus parietis]